jgi:hypothetical protein
MTKKTRNWLVAIFIVAFPFVLFLGFLIFLEEPLPPPVPLPNPNGYADLVKAGTMLAADTGFFNETNVAQVRKIVATNAAALVIARAALSNQCRVPVQFTAAFNSNHVSDLAPIKFLARAFIAEGRLAEMEYRPKDAAKSYLDTIRLANESARGGVFIDGLVGIVIEQIGREHLQKMVPNLDAGVCHKTAVTLETLDMQRQTWDELMQQESAWSHRTFFGWRHELARFMERKEMARAYQKTESRFQEQQRTSRCLIVALAARAYALEKGHPPTSAADLVPDYLKAVPQDPVTGTNLVLQ